MAVSAIATFGDVPEVPLALYESMHIGEMSLEKWGVCDIFVGLSVNVVEKLIACTLNTTDTALSFTHDGARFTSKALYEAWYAKGRMPFVLIHRETGALMALVWFGEKMPERDLLNTPEQDQKWSTLAYRSYPPYRGTGFMTTFTKYTLARYVVRHPEHKFWANIDLKNETSLHFAEKLGFKQEHENGSDTGSIFMTYTPSTL